MEIGALSSLKRYVGKDRQTGLSAQTEDAAAAAAVICESDAGADVLPFALGDSRDCKLFEIGQCFPQGAGGNGGGVYLAYRPKREQESGPGVWLSRNGGWHHLADSFTAYFRMMLAHLGLPLWQCCAAGLPLPTWVEQAYFLVGPHLLPSTVEPGETVSASLWNNGPINVLDPDVFKVKDGRQKNTRKK